MTFVICNTRKKAINSGVACNQLPKDRIKMHFTQFTHIGKHFRVLSVIMLIIYLCKVKAMPTAFANYISTSNGSFVHSRFHYFAVNIRPPHSF